MPGSLVLVAEIVVTLGDVVCLFKDRVVVIFDDKVLLLDGVRVLDVEIILGEFCELGNDGRGVIDTGIDNE